MANRISLYHLLLSLLLLTAAVEAYDYEQVQTFQSYSTNMFLNAWELGQGGATVATGRGSTGALTNPAALGYNDFWEVGGNGGTMRNTLAGGMTWAAWRVFMAGYGAMFPSTNLSRTATSGMKPYIQSNYSSETSLSFFGIGVSPWRWISLGIRGNNAMDIIQVRGVDSSTAIQPNPINTREWLVTSLTGDAGIQLRSDWVCAGFAYRNYGKKRSIHNDSFDLSKSRIVRQTIEVVPNKVACMGLAMTAVNNVVLGIEIDRANDFTEYPWVYKAGMQVKFNTWFTGRVGYDSELGDQTGGGVCLGTGMKLGDCVLDVALVEGTRNNFSNRYSASALVSLCYYVPYPADSPWKVVYDRKHYDENSLGQINTLKDKSQEYELKGNFKKALELLDVLLVWNPEDYEARLKYQELTDNLQVEQAYGLLTSANDYFNNGEYTDALHDGLEAKKLSPDDPYIDEFITSVQGKLKEIEDSRADWVSNLFREADNAYTSGDFQFAANKYADILTVDAGNIDAQTGLDKSVARNNKFISVKMIQAKQAELAKRYDEAITEYQAILDISPDNEEAHAGYAICQKAKSDRIKKLLSTAMDYFEVDEFDAAEAHLNTVLYIDSGNYTARNYLSNIEHARADKQSGNSDPVKSFGCCDIYQLGITAYSNFDYLIAEGFWSQIPTGDVYFEKAQMNMVRAQAKMQEFSR
jgi:tetratricopeptide (TPR) repeat protein